MDYFGVRISLVCVVENREMPEEGYTKDVQVHVVEAINFEDAFKKALKVGRGEETEYKNELGERVKWKFLEIEEIRTLGADLRGKEISSKLEGYYPENELNILDQFRPEDSQPMRSDG